MYKMIAFDIDGTLVRHLDNQLYPEILDMFKRLKENGYVVTLATGRDFISIGDIYKNEYIDYFIGANGMFIYDHKKDNFIFKANINYDEFKKFDNEVLQPNIEEVKNIIVSDNKVVYVDQHHNNDGPWFWNAFRDKFRDYKLIDTELDRNNFHLITIENNPNSEILEIAKTFFKKNDLSINIQAFWPKGMFVACKGVTKAQSIKRLCEHINIDIKEVIAFGDGENDKEMLKEVGLGIAMGNATNELKNIADDVTINVDEFGTKFFLEKMGII